MRRDNLSDLLSFFRIGQFQKSRHLVPANTVYGNGGRTIFECANHRFVVLQFPISGLLRKKESRHAASQEQKAAEKHATTMDAANPL